MHFANHSRSISQKINRYPVLYTLYFTERSRSIFHVTVLTSLLLAVR